MIYYYLDNCLLRAQSFPEAHQVTQDMMHFFTELGVQIKAQISILTPVQHLEFIDIDLDSPRARAFLAQHRFFSLATLTETVQNSLQILARHCLQLLGHMAVVTAVISHDKLHMQCLQMWFSSVYRPNRDRQEYKPLLLPFRVKISLNWWKDSANIC